MKKLEGMEKFTALNGICPLCNSDTKKEVIEKYPKSYGSSLGTKKRYVKWVKLTCKNGHSIDIFFNRIQKGEGYSDIIGQDVTVVKVKKLKLIDVKEFEEN